MRAVPKRENNDSQIMKILVIGNSGVGKTSIINKFCRSVFTDNHIATVGNIL